MRIFYPLIVIVFICACFETGGGPAATGATITEGAEGVDVGGSSEAMDTPPLAGPGETDHQVAAPIPQIDCRAATDYECLRLVLSREPLCSYTEGQTVEWSETEVRTVEPMSDGPTVDLFIEKDGVSGSPSIADLGLTITPGDADPGKPGYQLPVEADGTIKFRFKAGVESGLYSIKVNGTLGNVVYWAIYAIEVKDAGSCVGEALSEVMEEGQPFVLNRVEDEADEKAEEGQLYDPNSLTPVGEAEDDEARIYYVDPAVFMDHVIRMKTEDEDSDPPTPTKRKTLP